MKEAQAGHQKDLDSARPFVNQCVQAIEKIDTVNIDNFVKLKDLSVVPWDQVKTLAKCLCILFNEESGDDWVACQ